MKIRHLAEFGAVLVAVAAMVLAGLQGANGRTTPHVGTALSLHKSGARHKTPVPTKTSKPATPAKSPTSAGTSPHQIATLNARPLAQDLKIMNYYPARAPWSDMWTNFDLSTINSDMAAIASLNANAVRVIIQPYAVGYPTVSPQGASEIRAVVDAASSHGLYVMFTMFDGWGTYDKLTDSRTWLSSVLSPYANDPRIALLEIQNELPINRLGAEIWAQQMLVQARAIAPDIPRTISLSGDATTAQITQSIHDFYPKYIDVVDLHLYGSYYAMLSALQVATTMAPSAPIIVGETGAATGLLSSPGGDEHQLFFFRQVAQLCGKFGIRYFSPWTLNDLQWPSLATQTYGLRTLSGQWKPAAAFIAKMFSTSSVAAQSVAAGSNLLTDPQFANEDAAPNSDRGLGAWLVSNPASQMAAAGTVPLADGTRAAYMAAPHGDSSSWPMIYQNVAIQEVNTLTLSANVRTINATGGTRIGMAFFSGAHLLSVLDSPVASNSKPDWQQLTVSGHVPSGTTNVVVGLKSTGNSGTSQYTNVRLAGSN